MYKRALAWFAIASINHVSGNTIPRGRMFTSEMSGEGQNVLTNNLQFLCSLKSPNSDSPVWMEALQDSILAQISKAGQSADDSAMQKILTESILVNAMSNCEFNEVVYSDQPEKGGRQTSSTNVENILQNVFSGNIRGIIQSYAGGSTERVSSTVSDIFRSLLTNINSVRSTITNFSSRMMGMGSTNASTTTNAPSGTSSTLSSKYYFY